MSVSRTLSCVVLGFLFLISSTAVPAGMDANTAKNIKNDVTPFLQQAADNVSWMIILGELAQKQAASEDVRKYGARMIGDYRKHIDELNWLARQKGITLSEDNNAARRNTIQSFSLKSGADFDRNYISLMEDENHSMVSFYRQETQKGLDAEIRTFAAEKIKILEEYVARAHQILLDLPKPVLK